ncbi:MAG TPA: ribosome-associated translation inhibitor RaiA [Actinobacteria bacterium]|jgi:ribosomal subunit interface protein|nr:ribosome-associated translation inhibitor RaiA [Actinomycetota bacterium]HCP62847.1 ribosome-associated translation inhibitor RaiA [Actinomycetota bacterium]
MDLILKGRGMRVTDRIRETAEHKLSKLERLDHAVSRIEVELIEEHNPRLGANHHRVEVACVSRRRTYRAEAAGRDVDSALAEVADRLERQISTQRGKLRHRLTRRPDGLQSSRTSSE